MMRWITNWDKALEGAREAGQALFVDFYDPECLGCQTMDANTYTDAGVARFFAESGLAAPLRMRYDHEPQATRFQVRWTPCLMVLDGQGRVQQRDIGFQSPGELVPRVILGAGKACFNAGDWPRAREILGAVIDDHSASFAAPEAIYWRAAAGYLMDRDPAHLKEARFNLAERHPRSMWTERAWPFAKL